MFAILKLLTEYRVEEALVAKLKSLSSQEESKGVQGVMTEPRPKQEVRNKPTFAKKTNITYGLRPQDRTLGH